MIKNVCKADLLNPYYNMYSYSYRGPVYIAILKVSNTYITILIVGIQAVLFYHFLLVFCYPSYRKCSES